MVLGLNVIVQFVAMIMNHVYRLKHGGKVCSGDFLTAEQKGLESYEADYLLQRGKFLWILLIIYWVLLGLAVLACCGICALAIAAK
mmetsp:Transcript_44764/g.43353  ORF Transcript_44764/g.43353 Transcript_44764/m.43353 type:complete len:86 (-) Transcript_44764:20-277(-)